MVDLTLPVQIRNSHGDIVGAIEQGAAEGEQYLTLTLYNGDIAARNYTGGTVENPNIDIGAGSSIDRGVIVTNYDVGRGLDVGSGRKRNLATFRGYDDAQKDLIQFAAPLRLHRGAMVQNTDGTWRKL